MSVLFPGAALEAAARALAAGGTVGTGRLLGGIVLTILVCGLAYISTRFLSGRLGGGSGTAGSEPAGAPAADAAGWAVWAAVPARRLLALGRRPRRPGRLEIIERLPVGRDRQIMIVRVGDQHFLAGTGAEGVRFGPPVQIAREAAPACAKPPAFAETLARARAATIQPGTDSAATDSAAMGPAAMDPAAINENGIG